MSCGSSVICTQENTQCMNTEGSFECVCVGGYELVDGQCQRKSGLFKNLSKFVVDFVMKAELKPFQHLKSVCQSLGKKIRLVLL